MADLHGFDANQVEPIVEFEPLPADKYAAAIVESDMKPNKAGTGRYLQLVFEILEGIYQGRRLWARLNLEHPNPMAVQIAPRPSTSTCAPATTIPAS
jgi:hypothetical protein